MPKSRERTGRGAVCALAALALSAALTSAAAAPLPGESSRIPFAERFHLTGHGGIARTGHGAVRRRACRGAGSARLRLPAGSRVRYARLYWGGDLRAGGHRAAGDAGQVLLTGPHGRYEQVRADAPIGRRTTARHDDYQAGADVTALVRRGGAGTYTVARAATGSCRARAGTGGGWVLVAAYENPKEPLRRLALWDGFEPLGGRRRTFAVELAGLGIPEHSRGRAGVVAYHGTRENHGKISARAGRITPVARHDSAGPVNRAVRSAALDFGRRAPRAPAYRHGLGFGSEVFDLTPALRSGGDRLAFRFTTRKAGYLLGALFVQADLGR
ncbi:MULTISPECIES: hypothetical protein [unclassified Streptomyces]|uniref:hypothetical protein n=1 Tax=unclassified Streptomyces TaxID=2593676 RepID=UPI000370D3B2|nr:MULTISPECIES: hypothetical protein [unclassified Streptomyces]MYT30543.1 hypothetical protein [Streptomyces sp. SID8354]